MPRPKSCAQCGAPCAEDRGGLAYRSDEGGLAPAGARAGASAATAGRCVADECEWLSCSKHLRAFDPNPSIVRSRDGNPAGPFGSVDEHAWSREILRFADLEDDFVTFRVAMFSAALGSSAYDDLLGSCFMLVTC